MPERFDLEYVGADGDRHRPVMIHRAIVGSLERMLGILVEHYAGKLPLWLAPVQATVLPITDETLPFAESVRERLAAAGVRVELDGRNEKIGAKIRDATLQKVPYMLVVGKREAEGGQGCRSRAIPAKIWARWTSTHSSRWRPDRSVIARSDARRRPMPRPLRPVPHGRGTHCVPTACTTVTTARVGRSCQTPVRRISEIRRRYDRTMPREWGPASTNASRSVR